jgi:dihydrofolate reductase
MRKLIVANMVSLDGYYEGPGKNVMALFEFRHEYPTDDSFDVHNVEQLRAADTLLLGRASFEGFRDYWPRVIDDTGADPTQREISRLNNAIEKVVISDTLTPAETAPWHNTRIIRRADAHAQIAELKKQPGKNILMFGSHILWNDLLAHGLVDELRLIVAPLVVGGGTPLFSGKPPAALRLMEAHTWEGAGTALLRYDAQPRKL